MSGVYEKKLDSVEFSFYTPEEAKRIGLVEITSAEVYISEAPKKKKKTAEEAENQTKQPVLGGLADPKMGVSPGSSCLAPCSTCNQDNNTCQGHLGYLPLSTPVFNPFTLDLCYKLLKAKCTFCHRLKSPASISSSLVLKSQLSKKGKYLDAVSIEDLISDKVIRVTTGKEFQEIKEIMLQEKSFIEELANEYVSNESSDLTSSAIKVKNEVNSQLWKMINSTACPHCEQKQAKVKKEADNKIIREGLKEK